MILDVTIIAAYLLIINIVGICSSKARDMKDYFLGGNRLPWPAVCLSIVATETSTLTLISIPGLAYTSGIGFLQIAAGYIAGRVLVAVFLIPQYYEGRLHTVYEYLQLKFGPMPRVAVSLLFHITRLFADAIRLFATAIPLAMLMGCDYRLAVLMLGLATIMYTLSGGIRSVVIIDSIQFFLYILCAAIALLIIPSLMDSSFTDIFFSIPPERLKVLSGFSSDWLKGYNPLSGFICGTMLSVASHGTDHLMVQRVLSCADEYRAKKAMIWSGIIVFFQIALFLLTGLFIMQLFGARAFDKPDEIMPAFIIENVPHGLRGLMLAGMFAAAMSSLSSTVNSLSASSAMDILRLDKKIESPAKQLRLSKYISVFWMAVIMLTAMLLRGNKSPLVELGLGISSLVYGGVLAVFVEARFFKNMSDKAAVFGMLAGSAGTIILARAFDIFWTWYIPIGFLIAAMVSFFLDKIIKKIFP
ncbi:MAG: sodium:solute symporter [Spirochaetia bacterium]|jgi:SSS family transporter|nr:sodium:solute symporter [Spirochaetia bacterium]